MGKEFECKLAAPSPAVLEALWDDASVQAALSGAAQQIVMETAYYDTPARAFSARQWTLRLRSENGVRVVTLKTPAVDGYCRGEWSCEAPTIEDGAMALCAQDVPAEYAAVLGTEPLEVVCRASFLRKAALLRFADGSEAELACDVGELSGGKRTEALCEAELELKSGAPEQMLLLAARFAAYGLQAEPKSKFVRAMALARA